LHFLFSIVKTGTLISRFPAGLNKNSVPFVFFSSEDKDDNDLSFFTSKSTFDFSIEPLIFVFGLSNDERV
jgi:hypothetical protein